MYRTVWRGSISVDGDLGDWDSAQCGRRPGHVGGQRLGREQRLELSSLLVDVGDGGEGSLPQECVESLSLFSAHGESVHPPFGWNSPGTTQTGSPMSIRY